MFWQSPCYKELLILFFIAVLALLFGIKKRFFRAEKPFAIPITFKQVGTAFLLFFGLSFALSLSFQKLFHFGSLETSAYGGLFAFFLAFIALLIFISSEEIKKIWGSLKEAKKAFMHGALAWLIAYPLAAFVGKLVACFMETVYGFREATQVVAQQILALKPYPLLFTIVAFLTLFCVPLIEEILFRGLLQNYLLRKLPRKLALVLTASLFTLAHFNIKQGLGNIEILSMLFILSLFLSYIYEKERSLFAPIALHQTFNTISFIALLYQ